MPFVMLNFLDAISPTKLKVLDEIDARFRQVSKLFAEESYRNRLAIKRNACESEACRHLRVGIERVA